MRDWCYDIETYPNICTFAFEQSEGPLDLYFEVSPWVDDSEILLHFLKSIRAQRGNLIGFNNLMFDYPILHTVLSMKRIVPQIIYDKAQSIIREDNGIFTRIPPREISIPQIDLFKIHHFDNKARSTSLKSLEFNMRSSSIQDLPFPVGKMLSKDESLILKKYNQHDVHQTKLFYLHSKEMIKFREYLTKKYNRDFMNHNDTKIGKDYFIMELEKSGTFCYTYKDKQRVPVQTQRSHIRLNDAILPWIKFETKEFQRIMDWLKLQSITETKAIFKDLTARSGDIEFVFGLGGIHGSVESKIITSNEEYIILDLDVKSYYPNLAISNNFYPEHLGENFCSIYKSLYTQRDSFEKGSPENSMLKLALNGVYGDSNNPFSPFYDPLFTMRITLNGQLLLCLLAEKLLTVDNLSIVQINTDGLTLFFPRRSLAKVHKIQDWWQSKTNLVLEESVYNRMFIRDVNNYIAEYKNKKVKRKGAYEYQLSWHQNASALIVPKVSEKVLLDQAHIRNTIENWEDKMDFMLRTKAPRSSYIKWGDQIVQNTTRYYIAREGKTLTKHMPPLKNNTEFRKISIESGWNVQVCNSIEDAVLPIDYEYYINEVEKLCLTLR